MQAHELHKPPAGSAPPPADKEREKGRDLLKKISSVLLGPEVHDYAPLGNEEIFYLFFFFDIILFFPVAN
jgi:hypothetical protein